MELKVFATVFITLFLAELGDKSQLATMLYAADRDVSKLTVFVAASGALVTASALGVLAGTLMSSYFNPRLLQSVAGIGFIVIGCLTLYRS